MLELIVAFLCGVVVTVIVLLIGAFHWFSALPAVKQTTITKGFEPFIKPQLPDHLQEVFASLNGPEGTQVTKETCHWFNLIVDFLFRELRDSATVRRVLMRMINKEFEELLTTKTEGRMLEQLTLRDYFLGNSMPVIEDITIVRIECSPEDKHDPQLIELSMNIDYKGGVEMKIDADLVFNKSAYVAVTVFRVTGLARLQFTRTPFTFWSFSFYQEPKLELKVESQFEGRSFPRLSALIESQLRRLVRKKYTLPGYKIRHKPFFKKPTPQDQLLEVYVKDSKLTVGELEVEVTECSRLIFPDIATKLYCSLSLGSAPYKPRVNVWRTHWPSLELIVHKQEGAHTIGIRCKQVTPGRERSHLIAVDYVRHESAAQTAGLHRGDVLTRVNNVRVSSVKQVDRLISKSHDAVLFSVQRPPADFNIFATSESRSRINTPQQVEQPEEWDSVDHNEVPVNNSLEDPTLASRRLDEDSISLWGVGGEMGVVSHQGEGLRRRAGTVREGRSTSPEIVRSSTVTDGAPRVRRPVNLGGIENDPSLRGPDSPIVNTTMSLGQLVTSDVPACKNPSWNQPFSFIVTKEHNYLNVCVWSRVIDESCDVLIGHVTVPVMDIALECLCTSSGYHGRRYVLVAAQTLKPSVSRATLQAKSATSVGNNDNVFAGDILLRFKHKPQPESEEMDVGDTQPEALHESPQRHFKSHPFTASASHLPSNHFFSEVLIEDPRSHICEICKKKIWSLNSKLQKCRNCGLICHKKCIEYCLKEVPCKNDQEQGFPQLKVTTEGEFTVLAMDSSPSDKTDVVRKKPKKVVQRESDNVHRCLQQQAVALPLEPIVRIQASLSDSFELLDDKERQSVMNQTDGSPKQTDGISNQTDELSNQTDDLLNSTDEKPNQTDKMEISRKLSNNVNSTLFRKLKGADELGMYCTLDRGVELLSREEEPVAKDNSTRIFPELESGEESDQVFTPDERSDNSTPEGLYIPLKRQDSSKLEVSSGLTESEEVTIKKITEELHQNEQNLNSTIAQLKNTNLLPTKKEELEAAQRKCEENIELFKTQLLTKVKKV